MDGKRTSFEILYKDTIFVSHKDFDNNARLKDYDTKCQVMFVFHGINKRNCLE